MIVAELSQRINHIREQNTWRVNCTYKQYMVHKGEGRRDVCVCVCVCVCVSV